jgi:CHAT domain-containing protein
MLMARFYDLWRKEGLELPEALRQAQQWVRDTTNGEKVAYFENFLPAFSTTKMATAAADALWHYLILENPDGRDFTHPFYWAAFTYTGV